MEKEERQTSENVRKRHREEYKTDGIPDKRWSHSPGR
jgi:hypothetical protein